VAVLSAVTSAIVSSASGTVFSSGICIAGAFDVPRDLVAQDAENAARDLTASIPGAPFQPGYQEEKYAASAMFASCAEKKNGMDGVRQQRIQLKQRAIRSAVYAANMGVRE
jgi:hypothetical protein